MEVKDVAPYSQALFQLVIFLVGVTVTILIPILGWVLGPAICLWAFFMPGKEVWRCVRCRSVIPKG